MYTMTMTQSTTRSFRRFTQSGFGVVEVLLIVLALAVIGFAGYYVWHTQQSRADKDSSESSSSSSESLNNSNSNQSSESKVSESWYKYTSTGGEYTIRIADGLTFMNIDGGTSIYTHDLTTAAGTVGKVVPQTDGSDNPYGLFVSYSATSADGVPLGDRQAGFKTNSGLMVDVYSYTQAQSEGIGLSKGDKHYTYRITDGERVVTASYAYPSSQSGQAALVEQMVKTVTLP